MIARTLLTLLLGLACGCAARHPASVPSLGPDSDALEVRFGLIETNLVGEGLQQASLHERGFLPPGGRAAFPVRIAAGECALFVALGSANLIDLDAALYTAEGATLVEDDGASPRPTLTLCASSESLTGYFTLHAYQGAGAFVTAQFSRPVRASDDLHTAGDEALSALGQLAQTLHARGFEDAAPRVSLPLGDARPVRLAVNVDAGACYTLAAEGERGLGGLALRLVDASGDELANGVEDPPSSQALAALQYCASERADLTLEVVATRGEGTVRVGRFVTSQAQLGGARALWLGEPVPTAEAWRAAKQGSPGAQAKAPFVTREVPLEQGQVIELPPLNSQATCTRWDARLEPGLWRATLRVESEQSVVLGEVDAERMHACLIACQAGAQRVTLLGRAGFGRVHLSGSRAQPEDAERTRCEMSSGRR